MQPLDMTFIHAPATYDFRERSIMYGPVSDMVPSTPIFEMYPLGLTTLCEYLERHGLFARIYNLASMMLNIKNFDVEKNLAKLESRAFGIDLHWMPHCHGSIEVAKVLKRLHPDKPIIFGGLSSTIFHEDLITYDCIDYVIRGDSTEEPERQLIERISRAQMTRTPIGDLSDIPNLTWKDAEGSIHINPLTWVPDTMDAISMDYSYPMKGVLRHHDMTSYLPMKGWLSYPVTAGLSCRGCSRNCATCGGSAYTFRNHFGRRAVAWRDPALLIRDIENVQNHVWGPVFVLNDFLQAGEDYTHRFITGLKNKVRNPIGFEFFGPPPGGNDFYNLLDANLEDWSIEISAESHDDAVRRAFGKGHYTMRELEQTIVDALTHKKCTRFDLYFMTGIPKQTAASVRETGAYVQHLYELVHFDPRLVVMISPMAPFLDVGSIAFDHPEAYGYKLRARTFEEHRQRMILPSWKHIMNYESVYMTNDEMVDATYDAALDINRIKGAHGILDKAMSDATDKRIREAREQMNRLDDVLLNGTGRIDARLARLKEEFERLSENTMAEKSELNWAFDVKPTHAKHLAKLWLTNEPANFAARLGGTWRHAASDFAYPDQTNGTNSPAWGADGRALGAQGRSTNDGLADGRTIADEQGRQVAAFGSVVAPGFSDTGTNDAFDHANASLEAGRAGTAVETGEAPAISAGQAATFEEDPLLAQMMAEEREREELAARGVRVQRATLDAGGLQGAAGRKGAREARSLDRMRRTGARTVNAEASEEKETFMSDSSAAQGAAQAVQTMALLQELKGQLAAAETELSAAADMLGAPAEEDGEAFDAASKTEALEQLEIAAHELDAAKVELARLEQRALSVDTATGAAADPELSTERVKDIFSSISKKYERFNAVSSFGAYRIWLADVVKQAPITPETEMLDLAGGTGDVTFAIARAKHPKHIQCTDLVDEMLDVARAHYAQGAADGVPVTFEVVDAQDIPYEDASYDVITVAYGIRNIPERERAIAEMYRVLRPGGTLVCLDFSHPDNPVWSRLYDFYLKHMIPFWGGAITGDKSGFVYLSSSIKAFPDQATLARMFEDAGFTDITWNNHTGGIAAVHVAHKPL